MKGEKPMTNPKIEKVKASIAKTKATITEHQNKLRDLEKQKIQLENDEIVALFRREKLNEDEFAQLLRFNGKDESTERSIQTTEEAPTSEARKEENPGDFD